MCIVFPSSIQITAAVCMGTPSLLAFLYHLVSSALIMNWVVFVLILPTYCVSPRLGSNNGNHHKLKENFMIALGLSLPFGMGGPLVCQRKKATHGVSRSSFTSPSKSRFGTMTSAITSLEGTLKLGTLRKAGKSTDTLTRNTTAEKANLYSFTSPTGRLTDIASPCVPTSPYLPHVQIELVHRLDQDGQSNNEEPVKVDIGTESIVETMSFESMTTPLCWALILSGDCYIHSPEQGD